MSDKLVPADSKSDAIERQRIGDTEIYTGPFETFEFNQTNKHHLVLDMTPIAADAQKEIARLQYTVPAEEATKQAKEATEQAKQVTEQTKQATEQAKEITTRVIKRAGEDTKRHSIQYGVNGFCVLAGFVGVYLQPDAGPSIAAIIAVLGAGQLGAKWLDKKKKGDE